MRNLLIILLILAAFATGCCNRKPTIADGSNAYKNGDFKKASEIFMPKAKEGDPVAQLNIAFMHYCGLHVKKDFKKALVWYLKAANQNNKDAQFSIGTMYENGEGTKRNSAKAYFWYSMAEKQGDKDAKKLRRDLERSFSISQMKKIKASIKKWKPKSK